MVRARVRADTEQEKYQYDIIIYAHIRHITRLPLQTNCSIADAVDERFFCAAAAAAANCNCYMRDGGTQILRHDDKKKTKETNVCCVCCVRRLQMNYF